MAQKTIIPLENKKGIKLKVLWGNKEAVVNSMDEWYDKHGELAGSKKRA